MMDAVGSQAVQLAHASLDANPVSPVANDRPGADDRTQQFVALQSVVPSDSLGRILDTVHALSPATDPRSGQPKALGTDSRNGAPGLTDLQNLPPDLQQALATFRNVALEALVPNVAVSVTSNAASSIKRIQQGQ